MNESLVVVKKLDELIETLEKDTALTYDEILELLDNQIQSRLGTF